MVRKGRSCTWRELKGTAHVLESFAPQITGCTCIHRSDNQAAVHILAHGSRREHLQVEALLIHRICQKFGIQLIAEWVPREDNELADYYSKVVDVDDWQVNPEVFANLDNLWGPHTLDDFASLKTKETQRYCSRWWNPVCLAVDAFTVSWKGENLWVMPPMYLIAMVLRTLEAYSCHATIIVPEWVSAPRCPLLCTGSTWKRGVKAVVELHFREDTFLSGSDPWNLFGCRIPKC